MFSECAQLADRLRDQALSFCCHYLSSGRQAGRYWQVGDLYNGAGRSLYVQLSGPHCGRWQDAATGEYGDLLDIIRLQLGCTTVAAMAEARRFLSLPHLAPPTAPNVPSAASPAGDSSRAASRLYQAGLPIGGSLAERYLAHRGLTFVPTNLRYHPAAWVQTATGARQSWPCLLAPVTDLDGVMTGVHRTFLGRDGVRKAPIDQPRRALGALFGHAVRFGTGAVMLAGEGLETVLSAKQVLPSMPCLAALSAGHLGAIAFPAPLRRLYVARERDEAGLRAADRLLRRGRAAGIAVLPIDPIGEDDLNDDLQRLGQGRVQAHLLTCLWPEDAARFVGRRLVGLAA